MARMFAMSHDGRVVGGRQQLGGHEMANVDWYVEGVEFGNCNCDYSCPCQFEALPTQGNCRGFEVVRIDRGHFGEVKLDGLNVVAHRNIQQS